MLITEYANVAWNSRNKQRFVNLGYEFTKMKDVFLANVSDLSDGSNAVVSVMCDYCGSIYEITWCTYMAIAKRTKIHKDACASCCELKAKESIEKIYGSYSEHFNKCNDKRINTNIKKYGCENVFANESIKEKIAKTNLEKYGVEYTQQNDEIRKKTNNTCKERYGVENYVELFKGHFIKENSPVWKGGVEHSRSERATYEYKEWRSNVFSRDMFTCQSCGSKNGRGEYIELHAHHINNWNDNPDERYDVNNGITLCNKCHYAFHSKYGKRNNTKSQLDEFLNIDDKVC